MSEFIENPRRAPRAPVPCDARVAVPAAGFFSAPTSDVGPGGCQLKTPVPLPPGARVFLELKHDLVPAPCAVTGRVAWSAPGEAPRAGVAFDAAASTAAGRFFDSLAEAHPDAVAASAAPDRIPADAPLAPAPPPDGEVGLLPDEVTVLRSVGAGIVADAFRDGAGDRWPRLVNPLFALLGRRLVVLGPPDPAAAAAWAERLDRAAT
ncbi:PilZ domain-containing protein [Anaeromyxobacter oryzae]|uniref:PilZ domain-containing protein n=1 Tax=Anaeromyxobacter oryzae TaxID=2918170 RepID=A0ABM7WVP8_9BACT|nr:PilZ domain-containing protein [Anaeromyxobacter oryzae]BDG03575.1 hypothetical protein AMOR_25710 [Anaeromyxobacter oryzae]